VVVVAKKSLTKVDLKLKDLFLVRILKELELLVQVAVLVLRVKLMMGGEEVESIAFQEKVTEAVSWAWEEQKIVDGNRFELH